MKSIPHGLPTAQDGTGLQAAQDVTEHLAAQDVTEHGGGGRASVAMVKNYTAITSTLFFRVGVDNIQLSQF